MLKYGTAISFNPLYQANVVRHHRDQTCILVQQRCCRSRYAAGGSLPLLFFYVTLDRLFQVLHEKEGPQARSAESQGMGDPSWLRLGSQPSPWAGWSQLVLRGSAERSQEAAQFHSQAWLSSPPRGLPPAPHNLLHLDSPPAVQVSPPRPGLSEHTSQQPLDE